ncbi:MAG: hypothetical protein JWN56_1058 [Sphingobacteriales bacterium]|nr:hypothetical protein [Sphingobacteriales bacterium]
MDPFGKVKILFALLSVVEGYGQKDCNAKPARTPKLFFTNFNNRTEVISMKTIFDSISREELIARINALSENNTAQWGKMNLYQMLKHCSTWDEWILGKNNPVYKQAFIGKLFGKMALKSATKDDSPLRRNTPTTPELIIKENMGDIEFVKQKWMALIEEYAHYLNPNFIHVFFGKMTMEQIGIMAYKHADHHLRQFNG